MNKFLLVSLLIVILACGLFFWFEFTFHPSGDVAETTISLSAGLTLKSPAFVNGGNLPALYGCNGQGINPPLVISGVVSEAKSLALIVDDTDAPSGDYIHWVMWNIKPTARLIAENSVPSDSIQGVTSSGGNQYDGPCPPAGTHNYHFKIYALNTVLNLESSANQGKLLKAMAGHILDQADLVGLYSK